MNKQVYDDSKIKLNLDKIKHKILVLSGKGGVGKSTVTSNLAVSLSNNYKVGILDIDFHGPSIPKILGLENMKPEPGKAGIKPVLYSSNLKIMSMGFLILDKDSPVIWRGPIKMTAIKQLVGDVEWGELDYLIIDLPPGTGDEPLSIAQIIPNCDGAIIVTTPQNVALNSVRKSIQFVKKIKIPIIGIIENMSGFNCPHCGKKIDIFKKGGGLEASKDFKINYLGYIPIDPSIVKSGDTGIPFVENINESQSSKSFNEIVKNIEKIINGGKYKNEVPNGSNP